MNALKAVEQIHRAQNVCTHKGQWILDGTVHMTLGRQVNDSFRLVFIKQRINGCSIYNIHALKHIVRCILDIAQVLEIAGIGQHIHIDDAVLAVFVYKQANDVRANKSGTAGDDDVLHTTILVVVIAQNSKHHVAYPPMFFLESNSTRALPSQYSHIPPVHHLLEAVQDDMEWKFP